MKGWIRILVVLSTIIYLLATTRISIGQEISADNIPPVEEQEPDCRECHLSVYQMWEDSAHGRGLSCGQCHLGDQNNHGREGHGAQGGPGECMACHTTGYNATTDTWEEDDIHCKACHNPIEPNHPKEPMPIDRSVDLCGRCHIQARFDWQISSHGAAGVACVSCHNQHTTSLKSDSVKDQCALCHKEQAASFSHSVHDEQGLSCASCHLASIEEPLGEGSAKLSHTFAVHVKTCMECHEAGIHDSSDSTLIKASFPGGGAKDLDPMTSSLTTSVTGEPESIDGMSVIIISGLAAVIGATSVGLGFIAVTRGYKGRRPQGTASQWPASQGPVLEEEVRRLA
ncbi:MAG: cytochrome c3 family protein [Anaerolineales bacterium]